MSASRPLRSALAVALALAAAPSLAGEFEGAVFFGDSLTDSGHFQNQLPPSVRPRGQNMRRPPISGSPSV